MEKQKHINVICHNCLSSNFTGFRYICCECDNFNLCQSCKESSNITHDKDHAFVKISKPAKIDIKNYKNLFRPNKIFLNNSNKEPFETIFEILNKGEKNLKGCYISSIKASHDYLSCVKKVITEDIKKEEKKRIKLMIKFQEDEDEESSQDVYEGYYRLFTEEGIPFGDILYIQVITDF